MLNLVEISQFQQILYCPTFPEIVRQFLFQSKLLSQALPRCGLWSCGYCGKSFSNQEVRWSQCCGILALRDGPLVDCSFNADQGSVQLFFGEP